MIVEKRVFGKTFDGTEVYAYTLQNKNSITIEVINYGGIVTRLYVPDRNGNLTDIVLGRNSLEEYLDNPGYIGAIIGRNAGKIVNGEIDILGHIVKVSKNKGEDCQHGGFEGFDKKIWSVTEYDDGITLSYTSSDGEEGFPGKLSVDVTYTLTDNDVFRIEYNAVSDKDTVCNLTNHSYFNLNGHGTGKVYEQEIEMNCDFFVAGEKKNVIASVLGTPLDLRTAKKLGENINSDHKEISMWGGFDHHLIVNGEGFRKCAKAVSVETGISMEVYTNQPVVVLYSANFLNEGTYKDGKHYGPHHAFCLETQSYPSEKLTEYSGRLLKKGQKYIHITEYRFALID